VVPSKERITYTFKARVGEERDNLVTALEEQGISCSNFLSVRVHYNAPESLCHSKSIFFGELAIGAARWANMGPNRHPGPVRFSL
jgi:hypothetical protein